MEKHWKKVVPRSVCDYFFDAQRKAGSPEDVDPVISTPRYYLISIYRANMFLLAVCASEGMFDDCGTSSGQFFLSTIFSTFSQQSRHCSSSSSCTEWWTPWKITFLIAPKQRSRRTSSWFTKSWMKCLTMASPLQLKATS